MFNYYSIDYSVSFKFLTFFLVDHSQLRRGSTGSIQMENKRTVVLTVDKGNDSEGKEALTYKNI